MVHVVRVLESFDMFNHQESLANFIFCGVNILGYKMHPEVRINFIQQTYLLPTDERLRLIAEKYGRLATPTSFPGGGKMRDPGNEVVATPYCVCVCMLSILCLCANEN